MEVFSVAVLAAAAAKFAPVLACGGVEVLAGAALLSGLASAGASVMQSRKQEDAAKKARREARAAAAAAAAQERRAEIRTLAGQPAEQRQASLDEAVEISQQRHRRGVAATFLNSQDETL